MLPWSLLPRWWPRPELALPCGSTSTSSTRFSAAASDAARFTAVVVADFPPDQEPNREPGEERPHGRDPSGATRRRIVLRHARRFTISGPAARHALSQRR